ncbi:eukaryotic translation initiation factor 4E [Trichodelitschia bisporula]|uniref:Eukaryotic translation initiation factor 4E n=1 Tax=Trichodelitschia bisporula TaxID=703511 RepID=A0A6G1HHZ2_9PEZI|nr:eukaryotic translation initiation factor 4E [Trichodelitschia bisporula]
MRVENGASDAPVTVFHDPENFNVKHPLMNKWTLWFTKPPTGKDNNWNDLLKEVISFDSVEEFWGIYNNITSASELAQKSDYHLFKAGHGGKWAFQFRDKKNINIGNLWLHVMLAAIGETLEEEGDGEVMGVVVNTSSTGRPFPGGGDGNTAGGKGRSVEAGAEVLKRIGRAFKETLGLKDSEQVEFSGHTDTATSDRTRAKAKLSV